MQARHESLPGPDTSSVSVRMLWPFMRVVSHCEGEFHILRAAGIDVATLADPDARIPTALGRELLTQWIARTGDAALGVHAGESIESADYGVVHHAVRNSPNLRQGLLCIGKYMRLLDDNVEGVLVEGSDRGAWQLRNRVARPVSAVNDYQVVSAAVAIRGLVRNAQLIEVHLVHREATCPSEYARVFRVPVRLGAEHNAVILAKDALEAPIRHASRDLLSLFDRQAKTTLEELTGPDSTRTRVQQVLSERLDEGNPKITETARRLHMSTATLRRRLAEEGTTHTDLLDELRRDMALRHMRKSRLAIGEIAFLLGFSSQSAFGKAFRRWVGSSPLEYRSQLRERGPLA